MAKAVEPLVTAVAVASGTATDAARTARAAHQQAARASRRMATWVAAVAVGAASGTARDVALAAQMAAPHAVRAPGTATRVTAVATAEQATAATALPTAGANDARALTIEMTTGTAAEPAPAAASVVHSPLAASNHNRAVMSTRRVCSTASSAVAANQRTAPKEGWSAPDVMTGKGGSDRWRWSEGSAGNKKGGGRDRRAGGGAG